MELVNLLEEFHQQRLADDKSRDLISQISEHETTIVEEYTKFFNVSKPKNDWHFWWVFGSIPICKQLEMIQEALNSANGERTSLQKHILAERRLIDILQVPDDSPHKVVMKMLGYGWEYYMKVCLPPEEHRDAELRNLVPYVKGLLVAG